MEISAVEKLLMVQMAACPQLMDGFIFNALHTSTCHITGVWMLNCPLKSHQNRLKTKRALCCSDCKHGAFSPLDKWIASWIHVIMKWLAGNVLPLYIVRAAEEFSLFCILVKTFSN